MSTAKVSDFAAHVNPPTHAVDQLRLDRWRVVENERAQAYPVSRWYIRPLAGMFARFLEHTAVRPAHLSLLGLAMAITTVALMYSGWYLVAAATALAAWFFDRADGQLARLQHQATPWGAWLDGNLDELVDVAWHIAAAVVLAQSSPGDQSPWLLVIAFLGGKYLFFHGLSFERELSSNSPSEVSPSAAKRPSLLSSLYHLPGNADVRLHLFLLALCTNLLWWELAAVAVYYNFRWLVRYLLVARRLSPRGAR